MSDDELDLDVTEGGGYHDHHVTPGGDTAVFASNDIAGPLTGTQPPAMGRRAAPRRNLPDLRRARGSSARGQRRPPVHARSGLPWRWLIGGTALGVAGIALLVAGVIHLLPGPAEPAATAAPDGPAHTEVGGR